MRRTLTCLSLLLVLSACGGGGDNENTSTPPCSSPYWDGTVGTCLPQGWHVVDRDILRERGLPAEVIAAFQADQAVSGQFPTITVTRELLSKDMTAAEYSEASIQSVGTLPGYSSIDTRSLTVDGQQVALHIFSAQLQESQPKQWFYQVSAVSGKNGYTYTAALPLSVEDSLEQRVLLILQNVTFRDVAQSSAQEQ